MLDSMNPCIQRFSFSQFPSDPSPQRNTHKINHVTHEIVIPIAKFIRPFSVPSIVLNPIYALVIYTFTTQLGWEDTVFIHHYGLTC